MKNLVIVFSSFFILCISEANTLAVKFCSDLDLQPDDEVFFNRLTPVNFDGFFLIDAKHYSTYNNYFCYSTALKVYENKFSFNTNTLLVKTTKVLTKQEQLAQNLNAHKFIPKLYKLESLAKNENDLKVLAAALKQEKWCESVHINQVFTLQSTSTNDPIYDRQWSIENTGSVQQYSGTPGADMHVDSAWTISQGSTSIKIAILDSGVDTLHEDLIANLQTGYDAFATDSADTKGFPTPNFSSDGHGTACAGIAAATANNNTGVAGIAPNSQIIPVRIFYYQDYGSGIGVQPTTSTLALLNGTSYAWRFADADIISTSAGLSDLFIAVLGVDVGIINDEIIEAYVNGRNGFGVPMFFSAGNDDIDDVLWPGDLPMTIAIGASTMCDERKNPTDCSDEIWGSSYGKMLDVIAPGVKIASTDMTGTNGYATGAYTNTFNGTSAACPNAAGVGALILAINDSLHARDVKAILNITADRVPSYNYDSTTVHGTWNEEVGHGRINAFEALKLAQRYETTVSVRSIHQKHNGFSVYPNPSDGAVFIENSSTEKLDILVYDLLGRLVTNLSVLPSGKLNYVLDDKGYFIFKQKNTNEIVKLLVK